MCFPLKSNEATFPSHFSLYLNKWPFLRLFSATENPHFRGFFGDCASSDGPKHSNEELSSVPQCQKPVMCLMEKIPVIDR